MKNLWWWLRGHRVGVGRGDTAGDRVRAQPVLCGLPVVEAVAVGPST
ncbi:hypothetical protein [Saccharothrix syringae]|nr:hypothetical protein [Saccharothrix syringae]